MIRINLREPSFERLGELGRLLRRRVDGQDELAANLFRLETELLANPENEPQGLTRRGRQLGLLEQVVRFKEKLYRTPWAKLADARPGTLRLAPPKGRLDELAADYASMRPMLFGSYPSIDEIVAYMLDLEETINGLS